MFITQALSGFLVYYSVSVTVMNQVPALLFIVQKHQTSPVHKKAVLALKAMQPNFVDYRGM